MAASLTDPSAHCRCGHEHMTHDSEEGRPGCDVVVSMVPGRERCTCQQFVPVLRLTAAGVDALEFVNTVIVSDECERIELGPIFARYLPLESDDLVAWAEAMQRKLQTVIDSTLDARQERRNEQLVPCPGCDTLIAPDEFDCGFASCRARAAAEHRVAAAI